MAACSLDDAAHRLGAAMTVSVWLRPCWRQSQRLLFAMPWVEIIRGSRIFLAYGGAIFFVILYALWFQSTYNWGKGTAAASVRPFYSDHTIYSACIAFILPAFLQQYFSFQFNSRKTFAQSAGIICTIILIAGIFFAYCRAAWVSIWIATLLWASLKLKFKLWHYSLIILVTLSIVFLNKENIISSFEENNNNISTSKDAGALVQTKSITNITNDASNAERLNRWSCAWRMFLDKPFTGYGPGTYQFQYFPYQLPGETTYISVYNPYNIQDGHGGSAHNEYLLTLSESGFFGLVTFVLLLIITFSRALNVIQNPKDKFTQQTITWVLLGLFTYQLHGFFNNFLDTDKAAFLFWSALCAIATFDLENEKSKRKAI